LNLRKAEGLPNLHLVPLKHLAIFYEKKIKNCDFFFKAKTKKIISPTSTKKEMNLVKQHQRNVKTMHLIQNQVGAPL
jgi:hypothetical protein